ncbi:MAG: amidohydrolase [Gemmataceae bacterium]|nr:amidohydrolase [Gemmataceae bacterium]
MGKLSGAFDLAASSEEQVLSARWVFSATDVPLSRGTVTVRGDRIVSVDPEGMRTADIDFGNAAIIPGLVNAHTHLDLCGMVGAVPPGPDFVGWLRHVVAHRHTRRAEQTALDIRTGLQESLRFGTTLIGDIASGGMSWAALASSPIWAVCFREVLGLPSGRVNASWTDLGNWVNEHPDTPTCRAGVSPHSPYSVHRALIEAAARLWPVCIHLAESPAELELLESKTGPFVPFLKELGVWDPAGLAPSVDWVAWKASRAPTALLAHGNYLSPQARIYSNSTVVYCPRTHAAFGHPEHPWRELQARGVRIALGTDALASNPDLDILAEARFLHAEMPELPGQDLLRMATINGAESLGFGDRTGSLTPGKSADLVVVPIPEVEQADPHRLLFSDSQVGPRRTMWRGTWR